MSTTVYTYNNKVLKNVATDKWLKKYVDPYNPLGLPDATIRFKYTHGATPSWYFPSSNYTLTLISEDQSGDIYDWTSPANICGSNFANASPVIKSNLLAILGLNTHGASANSNSLNAAFYQCTNLTEVGPLYTPGITNFAATFTGCTSLTTVSPLIITSSATHMGGMFQNCSSLTAVPLLDTSSATEVSDMFNGCNNVQSGALALYQQASTQTNPPTDYEDCFKDCGSNTVTGAAELAQIPYGWK